MNIKGLKKLLFRILVVTTVFACIRFTIDRDKDTGILTAKTIFYFSTALIFFLSSWEFNDWLIKRNIKKDRLYALQWVSGIRILLQTLVVMLPIFAITYYVAIFYFGTSLEINTDKPWLHFRTDFLRATILCITVVVFNINYFGGKIKKDVEKKMTELQKEVILSKYKSLKSQISPHFLFNSLNTLTSLMYQDRDLASDFTSRLATCYRYILDNRDKDIIGMDKELSFLDSFIFMMDVRHQMSLKITTDIDLKTHQYVIPTLTLQMLVENALKHNYYSNEKPLIISIRNTKDTLIISNTLRKRKVEEYSTGLGLENIKKRFSYYTDKPVEVSESESVFKVSLPLLKKDVEQRIPLQIVS